MLDKKVFLLRPVFNSCTVHTIPQSAVVERDRNREPREVKTTEIWLKALGSRFLQKFNRERDRDRDYIFWSKTAVPN